jgi:plastocyanin
MHRNAAISIASLVTLLWVGVPMTAAAAPTSQTFRIGVDHFDPPNQEIGADGSPKPGGRVFLYTDFFTPSVKVHQGDILDFRVAIPDHLVQVATNELVARTQFPLFFPDEENALGSGGPRVVLGPAVLSSFGPFQTCGATPAPDQVCDPTQGPAITGFPNGPNSDWFVAINANPGSAFSYFCHLHPGMRGTVSVVDSGTSIQTQSDIDQAASAQFAADKAEAEAAYANAQVPTFTGGAPGSRTYKVHVGLTTGDQHVAIHDMLPSALNLVSGDIVRYEWQSNVIHSASFTAGPGLISPFGVDCRTSYVPLNGPPTSLPPCTENENGQPEFILDPGTRASGQVLNMKFGADSGVLVGSGYAPFYGNLGANTWSVKSSQPGSYAFQCTIHDWMTGVLTVTGD